MFIDYYFIWFSLPLVLLFGYETINRFETSLIIDIDTDGIQIKNTNNLSRNSNIVTLSNNDIKDFSLENDNLLVIQKSTGLKYDICIPNSFLSNSKIINYKKYLYNHLSQYYNTRSKNNKDIALRNIKQKTDSLDIQFEKLSKGSVFTLDTNEYIIEEVHQLDFENITTNLYYSLNNSSFLYFYYSIGIELILLETKIDLIIHDNEKEIPDPIQPVHATQM